jgi:predicted DCC family thiol-disulfide oxidoreductase YuxK
MHDADEGIAGHPVIVFDGHCVLCSANARFILRNDRHGHFRLAAMQGAVGAAILRGCGVDPEDPETLIVIEGGMASRNSDAVIAIWRRLGWPWGALAISRIVPRRLRDTVYCWVARNRYRLFGRNEQCFVPDPRWTDRIL